jgi:hypothetical protein
MKYVYCAGQFGAMGEAALDPGYLPKLRGQSGVQILRYRVQGQIEGCRTAVATRRLVGLNIGDNGSDLALGGGWETRASRLSVLEPNTWNRRLPVGAGHDGNGRRPAGIGTCTRIGNPRIEEVTGRGPPSRGASRGDG